MGREYTRDITVFGDSPITGEVFLHDSFEDILRWSFSADGSDYIGELDPNFAFLGGQSLYLKTRTADAAIGDHVTAILNSFIGPSRHSLSTFVFYYELTGDIHDLIHELHFDDGATLLSAGVKYDDSASAWFYKGDYGVYSAIPGSSVVIKAGQWFRLKLKVDFLTGYYHSLQINDILYDLSDLPVYSHVTVGYLKFHQWLRLETESAAPTKAHFDDYLIGDF